ncbi:MAG: hypothetical protein PUJ21_06410 [Clostridia bacterium]|nr:hypothetical protein [Clostridia bacterium]MDY6185370.1 hypothetical protein [Eubacteriales bacterium]
MRIHEDFTGGNIVVKEQVGSTVVLDNELRDTVGDWFYWAFCIEGAQGATLTFRFPENRLGYSGPAVSHDLKEWHWLGAGEENSFTYRFAEDETKVYFAHHLLYHPDRFFAFAQENALAVSELCKSRRGRSVPCVHLGDGDRSIILTARHHACESTGDYVLEGVLKELTAAPIAHTHILAVPFVDYDGVVDGDQGKGRAPHDHNRDYDPDSTPLYPEVAAIRTYAAHNGCHYGFDFHSPWHKGGENDRVFIVRNSIEKQARFDRFSALLERALTPNAMHYSSADDRLPMTGWNQPKPTFGYSMMDRPECDLAFTLESTYFGTAENPVTCERLVALGVCFAKALKSYLGEN